MANMLTEKELLILQKYRLTDSLANSFSIADLQEEKFLHSFIKDVALSIGAPSQKTAASIFIKRYVFLAVISLYSMTVWNKKVNLSLANIEMEWPEKGKDWLPKFAFKDVTLEDWDGVDRELWRSTILEALFAKNIFPIIDKLENTYKISKLVLWENIAVYLFWLYETELKNFKNDTVVNDFRYLVLEAEGRLFGSYNNNPLQKYYGEKTYLAEWDDEIRVRKTCCFSYQLPAGKRCKTCPCTHLAKDGRFHDGESICGSVRSFA